MIYISTGCSKAKDLERNIMEISNWGYNNIELTGGINRNDNIVSILKEMKLNKSLNFQCHNYFPPPKKPFVLNLSAEDEILRMSLELIEESLHIGSAINSTRYGIHAGFRTNPETKNLGKVFEQKDLITREKAEQRMIKQIDLISKNALNSNIKIYIENNVYSEANLSRFGNNNPFLLCQYSDYERLFNQTKNINVLLDIGHLKVSCESLNLDLEEEMAKFLKVTDYIHVSDNDGLADQNLELSKNSKTFNILQNLKKDFNPDCTTIEVYSGRESVERTVESIKTLL